MGIREDILGKDDKKLCPVAIPEWGCSLFVRVLNGFERDKWEKTFSSKSPESFRASLVTLALCDDQGERIFKDKDLLDVGKKSGIALDRIFEAACRLNQLLGAGLEEAKKNSENPPNDDFG